MFAPATALTVALMLPGTLYGCLVAACEAPVGRLSLQIPLTPSPLKQIIIVIIIVLGDIACRERSL
jgi:hypothetical protein